MISIEQVMRIELLRRDRHFHAENVITALSHKEERVGPNTVRHGNCCRVLPVVVRNAQRHEVVVGWVEEVVIGEKW